jgi:D-alanyl-D-alanine carboxypeptidase
LRLREFKNNIKGCAVRPTTATSFLRLSFPFRLFLASLLVVGVGSQVQAAQNPRHAAIVVDANTGETLYSSNASARRYPASLTKMMTLYITFEALAAGKIKTTTKIPFSAQAAAQPPTKLGVGAGKSITVETAILSLVTKSANDAAAALGEYFAGSEAAFGRMMTAKARKLGMDSTVFRNASGLPDPGQFTTARDMATLGIALREHFPQYYHYFSTRAFTFGRQRLANHNRLLGRVQGVDGIKTGFTRASGFNLVTSATDGKRRIVAVVMGGTSGASRDDEMARLVTAYLPKASTRKGGPLVAKAGPTPVKKPAGALPVDDVPTPAFRPDGDEVVAAFAETGETAEPVAAAAAAISVPRPSEPVPSQKGDWVDVDQIKTSSVEPGGWVVQVASSPSQKEATAVLWTVARKAGSVLASASAYTVPYEKDGVTYHRARFAGFESKKAAQRACSQLQKQNIHCYAVMN